MVRGSSCVLPLSARSRYAECAADFSNQQIGDFVVTGNRLASPGSRIPINGMRGAFTFEGTPVRLKMPDEIAAFHASSSTRTSPASLRRASSRRSSISNNTASFKLCTHSSEVRPWPLASGTSGQKPTYHSPSRCISAVNFRSMLKEYA